MEFSRRAVEIGGLGVVLALCAVAFAQPLLLFGAAGVGAWLLGRQRAFVSAAETLDRTLDVRTRPVEQSTSVDSELPVVVTVELDEPSSLSLEIEPLGPLAATVTQRSIATLGPAGTQAELTYTVEFHVAGQHELAPVRITLSDERGLFEETIERGPGTEVVVGSRGPAQLHVGRGASNVTEEFGELSRQTTGRGLEPQEVREYVPGDIAKNIDWNVTARSGELHVREYGRENDRHVLVILDQREAMTVGPPGETKLDYAREVTLGYLKTIESVFDSVSLYAVDDDAVTSRYHSRSAEKAAGTLRGPLFQLQSSGTQNGSTGTTRPARSRVSKIPPGRTTRLRDGTTAFERKLGPYFDSHGRIETNRDDPIQGAIHRERVSTDKEFSVVVLTDDTEPKRVWDLVRSTGGTIEEITLFLTPHVLFEPGGLDDLETAYERYLEFEEFRRELDGFPDISAFEVGPRDRFDAVLRSQRMRRNGGRE
jgi:uncharacterized protein (DUF58 family)